MGQVPLEARHRSSGLNFFSGDNLSFADYVAFNRENLAKAHAGKNPEILKKIIEGNGPFELEPSAGFPPGKRRNYKRGILLTHGLGDSPYFLKHLARFFAKNGFRVMAVLLPGHGTVPGDLLDVDWREWAKIVAYGADCLDKEVDEMYLGGFSAGAALSIHHSLEDRRVRGLFLFSPALKITPKAAFANWHRVISWLIPAKKWVCILPDADIYKYESFPKNAAAQMYQLTRKIRGKVPHIPIFAAASLEDATVDISETLKFMKESPPSSRLVLYAADGAFPADEKTQVVNSACSEKRILSASHTGILLPKEDEHYGEKGDYSNCLHYFPRDGEKYLACQMNAADCFLGEITEKNLKSGLLRRLMYNPHYETLEISMKQFIDHLS